MLSQTPGFFSTAAVSCPVTGAGLVCSALAMAESSVLSEHAGPTPKEGKTGEAQVKLVEIHHFKIINGCYTYVMLTL